MGKDIPLEIQQKMFAGVWWVKQKIWSLDLPSINLPISELDWQLQLPIWWSKNGRYDIRPIDVMENPESYPVEYSRTMNADLNYPVDVVMKNGRYVVLDGLHRLLKLKILGKDSINIRVLPKELAVAVVRAGHSVPDFDTES